MLLSWVRIALLNPLVRLILRQYAEHLAIPVSPTTHVSPLTKDTGTARKS